MKNTIEAMWKEGFLDEKRLVIPKINNLYNQKSKHVIDRIKRKFQVSLMLIIICAIIIPVVYYYVEALWQGLAASVLLLLTAWYGKRQMDGLKTLDHGATSLDYLKSFDARLKDIIARNAKIVRFSYPLYFLIAMSTVGSAWVRQEKLIQKTHQLFPDSIFIWDIPLFALVLTGIATALMLFFSKRIYQLDVRLMFGSVFRKLEVTIAEMETLKQE